MNQGNFSWMFGSRVYSSFRWIIDSTKQIPPIITTKVKIPILISGDKVVILLWLLYGAHRFVMLLDELSCSSTVDKLKNKDRKLYLHT